MTAPLLFELQEFSLALAFSCILINISGVTNAATTPASQSIIVTEAKQNEVAQLHNPIHYAERYYVPDGLLERKGGVSESVKETAMRQGTVFISAPLAQSDYSNIGVCESVRSGGTFSYVACPTADKFCCGNAPTQYCCSRDEFYRVHGRQKPTGAVAQRIVVLVLGVAGSLLFSACLCLIVCLCIVQPKWRKRTAARALRPGEAHRSSGGSGSTGTHKLQTQPPPPPLTQHTMLLQYPMHPQYSLQQPPQPPQVQNRPPSVQPPPPYSPPAGSDETK